MQILSWKLWVLEGEAIYFYPRSQCLARGWHFPSLERTMLTFPTHWPFAALGTFLPSLILLIKQRRHPAELD